MQIEQLIDSIQKRPKMFVKEEKIEYIFYLLSGYCGANGKLSEEDINRKFCLWFGKWLILWIQNNVNVKHTSQTAFWYDDIKTISKSEQDEIKLFFDLCKYFFEDYRNNTGYFSWRKSKNKDII